MAKESLSRLFSIGELYGILVKGLRSYKYRDGGLSNKFKERIMLAVTEVNKCDMCSYHHTKMALESGMANEEVQNLLSGDFDEVPKDELAAIMFAQHYADTRGNPDKAAWDRIVQVYGKSKAENILAMIRIIMVGNAYGIVFGSLKQRSKGNADKRSNLLYELIVVLTLLPFIPAAFVQSFIANLTNRPLIKFKLNA